MNKVRYTTADAGTVDTEFRKYFSISFRYFFQGFIFLEPIILIDLEKFDEHLKQQHLHKGSISECVLQHYGEEAHQFLLKLI